MAFTDNCDLFGSVHEDGINLVVRHIMRQRPSLFNYATPVFHQRPDLFCVRIEPAESVLEAGNPLFTEQEPLPILGAPLPLGLNFCLQLTALEIDFHPGNTFGLPPELSPLQAQRVALRMQACAGLDCPSDEVIEELLPLIERMIFEQQLAAGELEEAKKGRQTRRDFIQYAPSMSRGLSNWTESISADYFNLPLTPGDVLAGQGMEPDAFFVRGGRTIAQPPMAVAAFPPVRAGRKGEVIVLPTRELTCFCLELFAVGHMEWGEVPGSEQVWLKPKLDGIEIVDLQPTPMENSIECYLATTLRLGVLPNLITPMEKMILDITAMLQDEGLEVGEQITLEPAAVPADVPNNPAIEEDQIKVFINLHVVEGGS